MGTASQRGVLAAIVFIAAGVMILRAWRNPIYVGNPRSDVSPLAATLYDRLDPNTADWESLAILPGIGPSHARAIVQFREEYAREFHGERAFSKPWDLLKVKGIGAAMLDKIEANLIFPGPPPASSATKTSTTGPRRG